MKAMIRKEGNKRVLVVEIEMNDKGVASASGKTLVLATTHGNQATAEIVDGKPLVIGLTAYVKA